MADSIRRAVVAIPSDAGWWHQDGADRFEEAARRMLAAGIPEAEVVEMLESLFGAVSAEYGD